MVEFMIMEHRAGDRLAAAGRAEVPGCRGAGVPGCRGAGCRGAGAAPVGVGVAWSAVIMVGRVISEDRAGGHAPGVPGSWFSS
jgi:hypothetical protein